MFWSSLIRPQLFACAALLGLPGAIAENKPFDSIPFEVGEDHRVYVLCRVNDSRELRFLFDTGATDMVVNPDSPLWGYAMEFDETIDNLGATGTGKVKKSSRNTFYLGKQTFRDMSFIAIHYPAERFDGVIGLSMMRQQVTELDYNSKKIHLYRPGTYEPPANAVRLGVEYIMGVPVVPVGVTINGKTCRLRAEVDTGSDRVLDLTTPFVKKHRLAGSLKPFSISKIIGSDANNGTLENVWFDFVSLGNCCLLRIPGAFPHVTQSVQNSGEIDGILGNHLLKRFNLVFDSQAGFIYLIPNDLSHTPFHTPPKGEQEPGRAETP